MEENEATLNIKFRTGDANIQIPYLAERSKFGGDLKNHADLRVVIEGHADYVGGTRFFKMGWHFR